MKKLVVTLLLSLLFLSFFDSYTFIPKVFGSPSMVANAGTRTHVDLENNHFNFISNLSVTSPTKIGNGLVAYGKDAPYPSPFEGNYKDNRKTFTDYPADGFYNSVIICGASSTYTLWHYGTKQRNSSILNDDYTESIYYYYAAGKPAVNIYARIYPGMPYMNVTWDLIYTGGNTEVGVEAHLRSAPTTSNGFGHWDGVYVPTLGWHNYTGGDAWKIVLDSTNVSSWTDNYFILYYNKTASSTDPAFAMAFTNRTQIGKVEAYHSNSDGKITEVRWTTIKEKGKQTFTQIYISINNANHQNLTDLTTKASLYAHMALTERSLNYTENSVTDDSIEYRVTATYNNITTGGWTISPGGRVPTLPNITDSTGTGLWSPRGYVTHVANNTLFTRPKVKYANYETGEYLQWANNLMNDLTSSNFWVNQSSPYVVGFRTYKGASTISTAYTDWMLWGWYQYYLLTENATFIPYIEDYLDMVASRQANSGSAPNIISISTGAESGINDFSFTGLMIGYRLFNNATYLSKAEKNVNWINSNDKWDRYHVDLQMQGLLYLYEATSNATYQTWAETLVNLIFTGGSSFNGSFDDDSSLFGIDISHNSHSLRALVLALDKWGQIGNYNMTSGIEKGISWAMFNRDFYSAQILSHIYRYPVYVCHQSFAGTASLLYLKYRMENNIFNRTYFTYALENYRWIEGWNEKNYDFFDNANGYVYRSIYLGSGVPTVLTTQFLYDKAEMLLYLTLLSQAQNDVFQWDNGFTYSTVPRVTKSTVMISAISFSANKLKVTINGASGTTSITKVYCGDKGQPTSVSGATSWSYNANTKIVAITVTHTSSEEIIVYWAPPVLGDITGPVEDPPGSGIYPPDGVVDIYDLDLIGKAYGTKEGDPDWDEYEIADITGPEDVFDGRVDCYDLAIVGKNFGKTY